MKEEVIFTIRRKKRHPMGGFEKVGHPDILEDDYNYSDDYEGITLTGRWWQGLICTSLPDVKYVRGKVEKGRAVDTCFLPREVNILSKTFKIGRRRH